MRRGPILLIAAATVMLAGGLTVLVARSPDHRLTSSLGTAASRATRALAPASASPSRSVAPQPTESTAQRNAAAVAAAAAPVTVMTARISIPRIGIRNAPVYDRGTDSKGVMLIAPGYAVTHYGFSAPFGAGNTVLYGHDDTQGNIFGHLYDLAPGDLVQLAVGSQTQVYRVTGHQIVAPTAVSVLAPTSDARLTIITCWPFNVDTKRWIVTAVRTS